MTEKKTTKVNKVSAKKITVANKPKAKVIAQKEEVFPAIDAANIIGLSDFDFLTIKKVKKIDNGTLISISDMQKYYDEIIRR
jgi:hypothetical protein